MIDLTTAQQALLNKIAADANEINKNGATATGLPYISETVGYQDIINMDPSIEATAIDTNKSVNAALVYNLGITPTSFYNGAPSYTITTATTVLSAAYTSSASKVCFFTLSGTAYVSSATTVMSYYIAINGVQIGPALRYCFNTASNHMSFVGNWSGMVPVGSSTITVVVSRLSGAGDIAFDSNDFVALTIVG